MIHKHGNNVTRNISPVDFSVTPKNCPRFSSPCTSNTLKALPKQGQRAHIYVNDFICMLIIQSKASIIDLHLYSDEIHH